MDIQALMQFKFLSTELFVLVQGRHSDRRLWILRWDLLLQNDYES
jgi:hypothetical protein